MLTGLIVGWVIVTTLTVILAYYRMTLGLHDMIDLHIAMKGGLDPEEARRGARMGRLDKFGIPMTVLSALMAVGVVLVWAMESAGGR
jgi:hypothetical protein